MESKDDNKENIPPYPLFFHPLNDDEYGTHRIEFRGKKRPLSPIMKSREETAKKK